MNYNYFYYQRGLYSLVSEALELKIKVWLTVSQCPIDM